MRTSLNLEFVYLNFTEFQSFRANETCTVNRESAVKLILISILSRNKFANKMLFYNEQWASHVIVLKTQHSRHLL